jgi:hypothetical protein
MVLDVSDQGLSGPKTMNAYKLITLAKCFRIVIILIRTSPIDTRDFYQVYHIKDFRENLTNGRN